MRSGRVEDDSPHRTIHQVAHDAAAEHQWSAERKGKVASALGVVATGDIAGCSCCDDAGKGAKPRSLIGAIPTLDALDFGF